MPFARTLDPQARELLKERQRAVNAKRKAAMAADPRIQAMRQAMKDRRHAAYEQSKARRKVFVEEQKRLKRAHGVAVRAKRDAVLMQIIRSTKRDGG